eukprot:355886-Chlamydomonas_euryale.AAC.1
MAAAAEDPKLGPWPACQQWISPLHSSSRSSCEVWGLLVVTVMARQSVAVIGPYPCSEREHTQRKGSVGSSNGSGLHTPAQPCSPQTHKGCGAWCASQLQAICPPPPTLPSLTELTSRNTQRHQT